MLLSPIPLLEASEGMKHSYDSCPRGNFVAYVPVRLLTLVYSVAFVRHSISEVAPQKTRTQGQSHSCPD